MKRISLQKALAPAALVALYVFFAIFGKNFFDVYTLKTILETSYYVGFMAFGVTLESYCPCRRRNTFPSASAWRIR